MDRWRAAWALLALVACFASSAAAPTIGNHTALDLYNAPKEGCYYNFQHYGEGDRIMTNEPCLNCTCHNRMLMCYLRVCPFTKAIGQDCTVEKRADQCCPIVTCPDVPVDLLTSTTSSPAEYGGTGVGKVDNYGCSINGRYFPEGAKVPPTPNKPCEHCYCIRNLTTCVMQECTLHVDGCTPIYHKDVCCPVRYHCDHPEDEMPLLDDMSTTERPTPGFILTTPAPTEPPVTESTRRDCVENDQLYPDGALIKTEKPCVHCYCMKGDIVCVVQECGTPMENEGKNCTSLPPREGQCCPDTYICEGDELTTEFTTETQYIELTTLQPPRRVSVEGSGYRNEPDESPYTEIPIFASETEGSGEEILTVAPLDEQEPTKGILGNNLATEGIPQEDITTQVPLSEQDKLTTVEPDKGLNIMPSGTLEDESSVPPLLESTTPKYESKTTQASIIGEQETESNVIVKEESTEPSSLDKSTPEEEITSTEPAIVIPHVQSSEPAILEKTTIKYEEKTSEAEVIGEQTTISSILVSSTQPTILEDTVLTDDMKTTELPIESEHTISSEIAKEETSEPSVMHKTTLSELETTQPSVMYKTTLSESETTEASTIHKTTQSELKTTEESKTSEQERESSHAIEGEETDAARTSPVSYEKTTETTTSSEVSEIESTEPSLLENTTKIDLLYSTEPAISVFNTIPGEAVEKDTSEPSILEKITPKEETKTEPTITSEFDVAPSTVMEDESSEPSVLEETAVKDETKSTETPIAPVEEQTHETGSVPTIVKEDENVMTTEPEFRRDGEGKPQSEIPIEQETEKITGATDAPKETSVTAEYELPSEDTVEPTEYESQSTTKPHEHETKVTEQQETITESIMELSTFAHIAEEGTATSPAVEIDLESTTPVEKLEIPETSSINPEDNEIGEDVSQISSPGRIPGEGDCLINGITYKNDSVIPSTNKCHSSCKCISSIIKCDPIICSPPPEYMENCQLTYDTPQSCCPTYVCDHSKETIPPQSHSQMSGTESPIPSPAIECDGDQCEVSKEKQPPTIPSEPSEQPGVSDCDANGCEVPVLIPAHHIDKTEECDDNKCIKQPTAGCSDGKCEQPQTSPTKDQPLIPDAERETKPCENPEGCTEAKLPPIATLPCEGESCIIKDKPCESEDCMFAPGSTPSVETPQICENPEDCKKIIIPEISTSLCKGEPCTPLSQEKPCDSEHCEFKPEVVPSQAEPQICENGEDCKQSTTSSEPCEGKSCTKIECNAGECNLSPKPSQEPEICNEEDGCKKKEQDVLVQCITDDCKRQESPVSEDKITPECTDSECLLQKPISTTKDSTTASPLITDLLIPDQPKTPDVPTELPETDTTLSKEPITFAPETTEPEILDKTSVIPESPTIEQEFIGTTPLEDYVTKLEESTAKIPEYVSELPESPVTEHKLAEMPTEESELPTEESELPKPFDTDTKPQGSTTTAGEIITEIPEISVSTETSLDQESQVEFEAQTEIPNVTELYESETTKISEDEVEETSTKSPQLVEEQDTMRTELPEHDQLEQVTKAPEVLEAELQDKFTKLPGTPSIEETKQPEPPLRGMEQETSTESRYTTQEILSTNAQETATKLTESPVTALQTDIKATEPSVSETEKPEISEIPVESATKIQDNATEIYAEEESTTTKLFVSSITEGVTEVPESHSIEPERSTETLDIHTSPPKLATNELPVDIPDRSGTGPYFETSTLLSNVERKTTAVSDIIETDITTQSPELSSSVKYETTDSLPTEKGELPESQESETQGNEFITPDYTRTELPAAPTSSGQDTMVSELMTDQDKVQTETPLSQVTMSEQSDLTTSQIPIVEHDELYTKSPESYSEKPEETVLEKEKPIEKPASHDIAPSKTDTEIKEQSTTTPEIQTEIPEKFESEIEKGTELPATISTEPERMFSEKPFTVGTEEEFIPEKESTTDAGKVTVKESNTTEQHDQITEAPVTSITLVQPIVTEQQESSTKESSTIEKDESPLTDDEKINTESPAISETEYPYVPYKEPVGTQEEPDIKDIVEVTESEKPSVTEEYEIDTEVPERPLEPEPEIGITDLTTEQADLEIKSPEPSRIPGIVTDIPVIAVTETRRTDEVPESQEKVTEVPEHHVSQDIEVPSTDVTESQIYTTQKETTEGLVQESETKAPTQFVTKGQEINTDVPESHATTSPQDIIEHVVTGTEIPKLSETESPELLTTVQEIDTRGPVTEKTEPQEIETKEPSELSTKTPTIEEEQTKLPGVHDIGMVSQTIVTEQPELLTTEQSETGLLPTKVHDEQRDEISTVAPVLLTTKSEEKGTVVTEQQAPVEIITEATGSLQESSSKTPAEETTNILEESEHTPEPTTEPKLEYSETTPYLIELEEHTHNIDEDVTILPSEQPTTTRLDEHGEQITEKPSAEKSTEISATITPYEEKEATPPFTEEPFRPALQQTTSASPEEAPEKPVEQPQTTLEPSKSTSSEKETDLTSTTLIHAFEEKTQATPSTDSDKPFIPEKELVETSVKEITPSTTKPFGSNEVLETTAPEKEFIPVTVKTTTAKIEEEATTQPPTLFDKITKPEDKPGSEISSSTSAPEVSKPGLNELQPTDEVPSPEDESQFSPSGGYGQEPDYVEEDQAFGPGTCRYGGKVYVSAQQIPRDDPCDFCFCFRSDIICLQQSCPPPIHGCHEEPIQGFCCPRYECPVSMATTLNVTTTTTTTTTTLPPHFLPHAYKGAAQRRGCQIKGHTYKVGEVVRASSGPCLHCTCGGDGQMKCDPKACTPEPMLRQMIAAAVSAKRRR